MKRDFSQALNDRILVCDGAMGTMLIAAGAITGTCPEEVNLTAADKVKAVLSGYVAVGVDIITTNSFGGSRLKLAKSNMDHLVREINLAAARIAREVAGDKVFVAGSIGPLGDFLEPLGMVTFQQAVDVYKEQTLILAEGGVDLIIIETMTDLQEALAAIQGVREGPGLPIICTMTFDKKMHTVMGVSAAKAAQSLGQLGVVLGSNCGNGPEQMLPIIAQMREAFPEGLLIAQSNAGLPRLTEDNDVVYDMTPAQFAAYVPRFLDLGVRIIGGCCGTTPEHIQAVVEGVRRLS